MATQKKQLTNQYIEITGNTCSVLCIKGKITLTIQASQPDNNSAPMLFISSGQSHPIKIKSGEKLYAKSSNLNKAIISYTEV